MSTFQLFALAADRFAPWFQLDDEALRARGARRMVADVDPGYPCRVSLADASVGDSVILLPYEHHAVDSPYRASGPIFVREAAVQSTPAEGEVPEVLRRRQLSLRAYGADHMMRDAILCPGEETAARLERLFEDPHVDYVHLHYAKPGCFACEARRVG